MCSGVCIGMCVDVCVDMCSSMYIDIQHPSKGNKGVCRRMCTAACMHGHVHAAPHTLHRHGRAQHLVRRLAHPSLVRVPRARRRLRLCAAMHPTAHTRINTRTRHTRHARHARTYARTQTRTHVELVTEVSDGGVVLGVRECGDSLPYSRHWG